MIVLLLVVLMVLVGVLVVMNSLLDGLRLGLVCWCWLVGWWWIFFLVELCGCGCWWFGYCRLWWSCGFRRLVVWSWCRRLGLWFLLVIVLGLAGVWFVGWLVVCCLCWLRWLGVCGWYWVCWWCGWCVWIGLDWFVLGGLVYVCWDYFVYIGVWWLGVFCWVRVGFGCFWVFWIVWV